MKTIMKTSSSATQFTPGTHDGNKSVHIWPIYLDQEGRAYARVDRTEFPFSVLYVKEHGFDMVETEDAVYLSEIERVRECRKAMTGNDHHSIVEVTVTFPKIRGRICYTTKDEVKNYKNSRGYKVFRYNAETKEWVGKMTKKDLSWKFTEIFREEIRCGLLKYSYKPCVSWK